MSILQGPTRTSTDRHGRNCIGRFVRVRHKGKFYWGTVVDHVAGEEQLPKRVRVQTGGQLQGKVLMPGEYDVWLFL